MSLAEWHQSKLENPIYRSNIRSGIKFLLDLTPLLWTFCLGWGSVYCVTETLRIDYSPRIGNDGIVSGLLLLPAAGLLCFKAFWMILRKSVKAALYLAAVTHFSFFTLTILSVPH